MKYLKKFNTHSDYETFTGSTDFILPNVSYCVNEDEVHFSPIESYDPILKFTAEEVNSTIKLNRIGTATTLANASLQYSTDNGETWNGYTLGNAITLSNVDDSVKFKGTNATLSTDYSNFHQFVMTGKIKATGDVTSLFNEVGGDFSMPSCGCMKLFQGCTSLTTAPELPSTTLASYCYEYMFYGCTSLTAAPELPATTLVEYCYSNMFRGCTSLTTAPELPATTLGEFCYQYMFRGCTSLTTAPELPATTLVGHCYSNMFRECTSLTTAPELPATTLVSNCYTYMFYKCSNLSYIKALFTTTPSSTYTNNWVSGVKSTGTFVKNASADWNVTGNSGIPNGWTVETATA